MKFNYRDGSEYFNFQWSIGYYLRRIINKVSYGFLLTLSLFLLLYRRDSGGFSTTLRNAVTYQIQPFVFIARTVSSVLESSKNELVSLWHLRKDNIRFMRENFDLRLKLLELELIQSENSELRGVLGLVDQNCSSSYAIKKINTIGTGGIIHKLQFFLDKNDNISEHDLVLDKYGNLAGRVINVSSNKAEVLLVSDYTSKIPAKLENSGIKVIAGGNGSNILDIHYFFNNDQNIVHGENAYTSDDGNIVQEGILIGKLIKIGKKYGIKINSDLGSLNFVIVASKNSEKNIENIDQK